jgi:hypothetical protein
VEFEFCVNGGDELWSVVVELVWELLLWVEVWLPEVWFEEG